MKIAHFLKNHQIFGDFAIKFQVRLYLPKLKGRGRYKNEFIKSLHQRYKDEGIKIPYAVLQ